MNFEERAMRYNKRNILIHELSTLEKEVFNLKLYHLKGEDTFRRHLPSMPGKTETPHRHAFHEICFFKKGGGIHEIDFEKFPVEDYSIHFVKVGQVHLLSSTRDVNGRVMAFSPELLWNKKEDPIDTHHYFPFFNPLNPIQILKLNPSEFDSIMESVENLARDKDIWLRRSRTIIKSHLQIILEKCYYFVSREDAMKVELLPGEVDIVTAFKQLVELHFKEKHQVQEYSYLLNITSGHLNRYCKFSAGQTASEILFHRITLEAKRLLLFTNLASKVIAYELGFEDPSYFSRYFKRNTGLSPLAFRESMREKYH